jgi:hypothetical protein
MDFGWLPRAPRRPRHPVLTILGHIRDTLTRIAKDTTYTLADLTRFKEYAVAQFDALNDRLDRLNASLDEAKQRIADDFQALKDQLANDTDDQAAVDAAVARLDASIASLDAVDPEPNSPAPTDPAVDPNEV